MRCSLLVLLFVVAGCSGAEPEHGDVEAPPAEGVGVAGAAADQVQADELVEAGSAAPEAPAQGEPEPMEAEPAPVAGSSADAAAGTGGSSGAPSTPAHAGTGGSSAGTGGTGGSATAGTGGAGGSAGSSVPVAGTSGSGGTGGSTAPTPNPTCTCNTLVSGQPAIIAQSDWCWALADEAPPATSPYSMSKLTGCRTVLEAQSQGVAAVRAFCCGDES